MKLIKDIIPVGSPNRPGRKNIMTSITIHNTDNTAKGANAKSHAAYIKKQTNVSWHYTVDDKEIYQHLPDNEASFHTNNREGNDSSIAIEICMNADGNLLKATDNAVDLVVQLCRTHGLNQTHLKQHFDWSGKNCPSQLRKGIPYPWETFKTKVKERLQGDTNMTVKEAINILVEKGVITSPNYWLKAVEIVKNLDQLIINVAKKL